MRTHPSRKTAVLIDDDPQSRRTLRLLLADYCPGVEIIGEADGVLSGFKLLRHFHPDVVFLEVQMVEGTGFDLLDRFPSAAFQVIFTTAYDEFALKAFRYNAVDYLLKPLDIDELIRAVERIASRKYSPTYAEQISNMRETSRTVRFEKIAVASNEGLHFINLKDIVRLESDVNYTIFHLISAERIMVSKTLKSFEQLLPEDEFFRSHQSHIVNVAHIEKILKEDGGYLLMKGRTKIPIARSKKEKLLNIVKGRFLQ